MNRDFKKCIERKSLYEAAEAKGFAEKELSSAKEDLEDARLSFSKGRHKWATIQAYYAMFHGARTLLYSKGYRERGHFCCIAGVEHLFAREELLDMKWIRALRNAMSLREDADYASEYSEEGANISIEKASGFLETVEDILKKQGKA